MNGKMKELIKQYIRYINVTASKLDIDNTMFKDLQQVGLIALYEGQSKFNAEQGTFHTFIMKYIKYEMMDYLTNFSRTIRIPNSKLNQAKKEDIHLPSSVSIETPIGEDGTIEDLLGYDEVDNSLDDKDIQLLADLKKYLSELKLEYQKIIMMREIEDMSFVEIGKELNQSGEAIRQKYNIGINKIRKNFNKNN